MSRKLAGPVADNELNDLSSPLRLLLTRRSSLVKTMVDRPGAGPTEDQIADLLDLAVRVPDHGKLAPWRFIVFAGEGRDKFGEVLANRWQQLHPGHGAETIAVQRETFLRTPFVVGVVSSIANTQKVPAWEQELSAGALCQNLLHGAIAMGFGAQWITGWYAYDRQVLEAIGVSENENIAGFVYIGAGRQALSDRLRPNAKALTAYWNG